MSHLGPSKPVVVEQEQQMLPTIIGPNGKNEGRTPIASACCVNLDYAGSVLGSELSTAIKWATSPLCWRAASAG